MEAARFCYSRGPAVLSGIRKSLLGESSCRGAVQGIVAREEFLRVMRELEYVPDTPQGAATLSSA